VTSSRDAAFLPQSETDHVSHPYKTGKIRVMYHTFNYPTKRTFTWKSKDINAILKFTEQQNASRYVYVYLR